MEKAKIINNETLDILSKAIALFTSLLIFLGIISSVVYYRAFSINILDNITLGEALLLFISNFTPLALSFIFGILVSRLFIEPPLKQNSSNDHKSVDTASLKLNTRQKLFAVFVIIPLFLLSFMGFSPFTIWILPLSLIVRLYVLSYIIRRLRLVFRYSKTEGKIIDYIQVAGISIITIATIAMTEAYLVYSRQSGKAITLHSGGKEVMRTDSATLYLGKSQSFYYLYDKSTEKAIVIKADQIDKIEIK
jgi:hypothetical protein